MTASDGTIAVRAGEALDLDRLEPYLRAHLPELGDAPLAVRQFPAGASNLTYLLTAGAWEGVLRRPPRGPVAPRAHDMEREAGLLARIHPAFPLAPRPLLICSDRTVLGVPFYVMERRHGIVLDAAFPPGVAATAELCSRIARSTI